MAVGPKVLALESFNRRAVTFKGVLPVCYSVILAGVEDNIVKAAAILEQVETASVVVRTPEH